MNDRAIEHYRRHGYVLVRNLLGPRHVAECIAALDDIASGAIATGDTVLMYEARTDPATLAPDERVLHIRKYMDFVPAIPVPAAAAMSRRTHDMSDRIAVEMRPGDALVVHSLLQHYTAANASELSRRALQFHYQQIGAVWCTVAEHTRHFHDAAGAYMGCTVPHPGTSGNYHYREGLRREIVPADTDA